MIDQERLEALGEVENSHLSPPSVTVLRTDYNWLLKKARQGLSKKVYRVYVREDDGTVYEQGCYSTHERAWKEAKEAGEWWVDLEYGGSAPVMDDPDRRWISIGYLDCDYVEVQELEVQE